MSALDGRVFSLSGVVNVAIVDRPSEILTISIAEQVVQSPQIFILLLK
jgi:hypothetical protein